MHDICAICKCYMERRMMPGVIEARICRDCQALTGAEQRLVRILTDHYNKPYLRGVLDTNPIKEIQRMLDDPRVIDAIRKVGDSSSLIDDL